MGRTAAGGGFAWLRKAMVLLQFAVTTCVIVCVLTMATQLRYLADKSLGFMDDGRLMVTLRGTDVLARMEAIRTELLKSERITGVSYSDAMLGLELPNALMDAETNAGDISLAMVRHLPVSDDFVDVMGMEIVAGRNLSADIATDTREAFVVNEAMVREMGWDEPIGKLMGPARRKVVGVVRDFNFRSLHSPVEPLVMYLASTNFAYLPAELQAFKQQFLALNVKPDRLPETIEYIRDTLARFDPAHPLDYRFVDDALSARYDAERRLTRLIGVFAGICIFVACFGLFGLASYTAARRTKEVGVRKVLGGSVWSIVILLTNDFSKLALLSNLIAWPLAYFAMNRWLENFAYRIDLTPLVFVGSGLIALCIAWVTVGGTAARAASMKPVLALRYE
jgi:putative ABC transport system permease protein